MSRRSWLAALLLAAIAGGAASAWGQTKRNLERNLLQIDGGSVAGANANGVRWFKGMAFAAPPLGNLRWRAPQPVVPWQGTRDASRFGPDCMQRRAPGESTPSEDCLLINVWTPEKPAAKALPVLVWIHGGGWVNGGSSTPSDDGSAFARQNIVFVSANYRLGRFGFFAHPALSAESAASGEAPIGNYGYLDQLAALTWIQRNIAKFGGDPRRVTLMGESAGAASILHLLGMARARGLFQRAVVMSGGGRTHLMGGRLLHGGDAKQPSAEQLGLAFAQRAGVVGQDAEALAALRKLPAEIVRGDLDMSTLTEARETYAGGPIVDGVLVAETPEQALRSHHALQIPVLIGTTGADIALNLPASREHPLAGLGTEEEVARAVYDPAARLTNDELYWRVGADQTVHEPARFVADQLVQAGTWLYRFDYVLEARRAQLSSAPHASEVPFVFQTLRAVHGDAASVRDHAMAERVQRYFVSFVKSGNPNSLGLLPWRKHDREKGELMLFGAEGPRMQRDPWQAWLDLIERAADRAR